MSHKIKAEVWYGLAVVVFAITVITFFSSRHPTITEDMGIKTYITARDLSKAEKENEAFMMCALQDSNITVLGKIQTIQVSPRRGACITLKGHYWYLDDNHDLQVWLSPKLICEVGQLRENQWVIVEGRLVFEQMSFHMNFQLVESQIIHVFSREEVLRTFD